MSKPRNRQDLESSIKSGSVIVFEAVADTPAKVQATLSAYEDRFGADRRVFHLVEENKYAIFLGCACGDNDRLVRTSDLHQIDKCEKCHASIIRERRKAARAARRSATAVAEKPARKTHAKRTKRTRKAPAKS